MPISAGYYLDQKEDMSKTTFSTTPRDLRGKKIKKLRAEGVIPGNVYVAGGESMAIQFPKKDFNKLYDEVGDTGLVYLVIGDAKKSRPTLVDEVQIDPVSGEALHVSFKEVDLKEKIEAEVPVELMGEFDVKEAVMVQVRNSLVVEALPNDLPEKFEINIESLTEIGQSITLADLSFDKSKISLVEVENDEDWQKPVVLVQEQRQEEVEEVGDVVESEEEETEENTSQSTQQATQAEESPAEAADKKDD